MREYLPTDDLRRIDWKATARSRTLMVREFAAEEEQKVTVYLDTRVPGGDGPTMTLREKIEAQNAGRNIISSPRFESAVSRTAALVAYFCSADAEVRLVTPADTGEFGTGSRHLQDCLRRLAVIEPDMEISTRRGPLGIEQLFSDTPESHNIVVTAAKDENLPPGTQVISV